MEEYKKRLDNIIRHINDYFRTPVITEFICVLLITGFISLEKGMHFGLFLVWMSLTIFLHTYLKKD